MTFFIDFLRAYNYILSKHMLMRIINKAIDKRPIEFFAKDEAGNDIQIKLGYYQFVFTPTKEKTRTININGRRGNIFIDFEEKPDYAEHFKPYTQADLDRIKAILDGKVETKNPITSNSVQANMNANEVKNQMIEEIQGIDPYEALNVAKLAEGVPSMQDDLQATFDEELKKAGFEDEPEIPKEEEKPKKKYNYKKKPGRPKKRGRPKKKNPRGRPPKKK